MYLFDQILNDIQLIKILYLIKYKSILLVQLICIYIILFQGNKEEMMQRYKQLLTYIKSAVTRNYSEKSINSILDYISTSKNVLTKKFRLSYILHDILANMKSSLINWNHVKV